MNLTLPMVAVNASLPHVSNDEPTVAAIATEAVTVMTRIGLWLVFVKFQTVQHGKYSPLLCSIR